MTTQRERQSRPKLVSATDCHCERGQSFAQLIDPRGLRIKCTASSLLILMARATRAASSCADSQSLEAVLGWSETAVVTAKRKRTSSGLESEVYRIIRNSDTILLNELAYYGCSVRFLGRCILPHSTLHRPSTT